MADTSAVDDTKRISMGPVEITQIENMSNTKSSSERQALQLGYEGRTVCLTIWGEIAKSPNAPVVEEFNILCIWLTNDFAGQRCYNSTPSTLLELVTFEDDEVEAFERLVESVSFESNLIEVKDTVLSITPEVLVAVFTEKKFEANTEIRGTKRNGSVVEI